ncbi:methyltransferase domain-containing protein [bacterium]|nr:methyltransferase domain-containing protein [bacterium]
MADMLSPTLEQTRSWYDRLSGIYDRMADSSERPARLRGLRLLNAQRAEHVLEIGFGTGGAIVALGHAVGREGRVHGIELSPKMRAKAEEKAAAEGLTNTDLREGNALALPYPAQSMDALFMSFTLELLNDADQGRLLREAARVLRPGGRIAVVYLSAETQPTWMSRLYEFLHRCFPRYIDCHPIDADAPLRQAGFHLTKMERFSMWGISGRALLARLA